MSRVRVGVMVLTVMVLTYSWTKILKRRAAKPLITYRSFS
jgi:hypothetical protein